MGGGIEVMILKGVGGSFDHLLFWGTRRGWGGGLDWDWDWDWDWTGTGPGWTGAKRDKTRQRIVANRISKPRISSSDAGPAKQWRRKVNLLW